MEYGCRCYLILLVFLFRVHGLNAMQKIHISTESGQNNLAFCGAVFMSGFDRYSVTGGVNVSGLLLKTVVFEKSHGDFSEQKIIGTIDFTSRYEYNTSVNCFCSSTTQSNIFTIACKFKVNSVDSNAMVRACMLIQDVQKHCSETVTLPTIIDLNSTIESCHLFINGDHVDITNCTLSTEKMEFEVLLTTNSTPQVPVQVNVHDGTRSITIQQNGKERFVLPGQSDGSTLVLNVSLIVCQQKVQNSVCLVRKGSTLSSFNVTQVVIFVIIGVFVLLCILLVACLMRGKLKKMFFGVTLKENQGIEAELKEILISSKTDGCTPNHIFLLGRQASGKTKLKETIIDYFPSSLNITEIPYFEDYELLKNAVQIIDQAIPNDPHSNITFLMVIPFGVRYDTKDVDLWIHFKQIFGENLIKHSIMIVTHADKFDPEETECDSIESWFCKQDGPIRPLLDEFMNRIVFFHNNILFPRDMGVKVSELMENVARLNSDGDFYNSESFMQSEFQRKRLMVEFNYFTVREGYYKEMSLISENLTRAQQKERKEELDILNDIKHELKSMHTTLLEEDQDTGILKDLILNCEDINRAMKRHIENIMELNMENNTPSQQQETETNQFIKKLEYLKSLEEERDKITREIERLKKELETDKQETTTQRNDALLKTQLHIII